MPARNITSLLHYQADVSDSQQAVYMDPADIGTGTAVDLPTADWEDLGRPDTITVTIEPGDHLNGPDA